MDLVHDAGVDVSDWANFAGGSARARTNPKYCYEWSFVQPGKVVVLNLWIENMKRASGRIVQRHNFLRSATRASKANWKTRARKMNRAVTTAWEDNLPIRVIICDGKMRNPKDRKASASQVTARALDSALWAVTHYDAVTGDVTITRDAAPNRRRNGGRRAERLAQKLFPDELSQSERFREGACRQVLVNAYERDRRARQECLRFFGYACAACDVVFAAKYGELGERFIHVHHTRPLSRCGPNYEVDPRRDLVPVCPNCHAMLHRSTPPLTVVRLRRLIQGSSKRASTLRKART
jgi:5-methylcytosine-specific restriction enzyme A